MFRKVFTKSFAMVLIASVLSTTIVVMTNNLSTSASLDTFEDITGKVFEFDETTKKNSSHYEESTATTAYSPVKGHTFGAFSLKGNMNQLSGGNISTFKVNKDSEQVITFSYSFDEKKLAVPPTDWHIREDDSKIIDGINTKDPIKNGAILVQTSLDGLNWVTSTTLTNVFTADKFNFDFYKTNDIQLINGCFFRVVVAYEMEQLVGESKVLWFFNKKDNQYKKFKEVYTFYAKTEGDDSELKIESEPRMELGKKVATPLDKGFDGGSELDQKDPHFGWDIGQFVINGFSGTSNDPNGNRVFLKNVGDKVTLWFRLYQDINCLNGDPKLTINEDTNGYDKHFEVPPTNFKRGTLIIQYTDSQNVKHDPIIYTDFLAANVSRKADTKVQLFEEGDYEVSLDYEIMHDTLVDGFTNYKIAFKFSIRNGNCMVFPFELKADGSRGSELTTGSYAKYGFVLDAAKSKYLTVNVKKSNLVVGDDNQLHLDQRYDRPVDMINDKFTEEGIYNFTFKNNYTGKEGSKTLYVGTNKFIVALATSPYSIEEINKLIAENKILIDVAGNISIPTPTPTPTPAPTSETTTPTETEPTTSEPSESSKETVVEETTQSTKVTEETTSTSAETTQATKKTKKK